MRILVVEDLMELICDSIGFVMGQEYEILTAPSVSEAKRIYGTHQDISLVVSDFDLGGENSSVFLNDTYSDGRSRKVIFFPSFDREKVISSLTGEVCKEVHEYVEKPHFDRLSQVVSDVCL